MHVSLTRLKWKHVAILFYAVACAGSATGCDVEEIRPEQFAGYYQFSTARGADILVLCADGTLLHTERGTDSSDHVERGHWSVSRPGNGVTLTNITLRRELFGAKSAEIGGRASGLFDLSVEVAPDGKLRITPNVDAVAGYVRQPQREIREACH